jgi:hypothetical protein
MKDPSSVLQSWRVGGRGGVIYLLCAGFYVRFHATVPYKDTGSSLIFCGGFIPSVATVAIRRAILTAVSHPTLDMAFRSLVSRLKGKSTPSGQF